MATPTPRVRMPATAKAGEVIEVKTLISHEMESGQRKDSAGKTIPRQIINKFTVEYMGKVIFQADIEPAVSANPYFQFKFRAQESGDVKFTWVDDDGTKIEAIEKITVN